ncbi:hypothetical protein AYO40_01145 [Planctomycetaceae bacterium SCGC AG-212-D15]|nr:hypothetical protein AYO40_01145 [Planctomycetaceae bacterium SCGC AG-212-D15]
MSYEAIALCFSIAITPAVLISLVIGVAIGHSHAMNEYRHMAKRLCEAIEAMNAEDTAQYEDDTDGDDAWKRPG